MIELTLADIADIVGGRLDAVPDPAATVTGSVEFDSRRVTEGSLFLALPGERVDGHDYAAAAVEAGAVAVLAARPVGVPAIVVDSTGKKETNASALAADTDGSGAAVLTALADLAREVVSRLREQTGLKIIGVTGSSGKTSTKDLLATVAHCAGPVVAPPGSFNNEIGHPWTALTATEDTRTLVLEMSARGIGHIAELARIVPPSIGIVLNVGHAHLGEFGSQEAIAQAKGELVESLPAADDGGVAILNADDPLVAAMAPRTAARVITYGTTVDAECRATDLTLDDAGRPSFTVTMTDALVPGGFRGHVQLAVAGEHQASNALAVLVAGVTLGIPPEEAVAALAEATIVSGRRMEVSTRPDGVTVINDSYNANPDSVRAALKATADMGRVGRAAGEERRTWAVLGRMGELGEGSVMEHHRIGLATVRLNISQTVIVGSGRDHSGLLHGAVMEGSWDNEARRVDTIAEACALLDEEVRPEDIVLVKASQSERLWSVADHLLAPASQTATDADPESPATAQGDDQ